jgi:Tfp pilus assembly pilus retraction ATPase PilT
MDITKFGKVEEIDGILVFTGFKYTGGGEHGTIAALLAATIKRLNEKLLQLENPEG